jgi:hypothetical protein
MSATQLRRFAGLVLLGALTVLVSCETLTVATSAHAGWQADFKGDLFTASRAILRGQNPYHPDLLQDEAAVLGAGGHWGLTISPRYPPISMLAAVPLALLPFKAAAITFMLMSAAAVVLALRLLGVRDWRCIVVAAASAPVTYGVWIGQLSPWLLLGTAAMWHFRDRVRALPVVAAFAIGIKLFLWPMGAWLLVTKRYRQLAVAVPLTLGVILTAWAVIAFAGLVSYPQMLMNVAYIGELRGSSFVTLLLHLGLSTLGARAVAIAFTAVLVAGAWRLTRLPDGEARAFGLVVVACLIASPVVWLHSLALLFVPIALLSPRLSVLWFLPGFASFAALGDVSLELLVAAVICAPLLRELLLARRPAAAGVGHRPRFRSVAAFLLAPI